MPKRLVVEIELATDSTVIFHPAVLKRTPGHFAWGIDASSCYARYYTTPLSAILTIVVPATTK